MRPSDILRRRKDDIKKIMDRYPMLANLRICGSVARGDDKEGSDIDFLVEPGPNATLFDLGGLHEDLEDLLGVPVDIISVKSAMNKAMKEMMLQESVSL